MKELLIAITLFVSVLAISCNTLDKEYAIVREIQKAGNAKDLEELTPEKIAMFDANDAPGKRHIVSLRLSNQDLTVLSPKTGELKYLRELWLEGNKLSSLPEEIGNLQNLKELWLSENNLTTLPKNIVNLKLIEDLRLNNNNFTEIPDEILGLTNLKIITLSNNKISAFKSELLKLLSISSITLHENSICKIDKINAKWISDRCTGDWQSTQKCQ
jgi:Leucine-rich repeat (LRR) protein